MLEKWLSKFRVSPAPLPVALLLVAIILALLIPAVDRAVNVTRPLGFDPVAFLGTDGARAVLTAIAAAMLTVATTAFSITISVVATASATYGPRLVGNFMTDRGNQMVLGALTGTFLYNILVLVQIPGNYTGSTEASQQVPQLALYAAILLAIVDTGVIIYFISHITESIQVARMASTARKDLRDLIDHTYPDDNPDDNPDGDGHADQHPNHDDVPALAPPGAARVLATKSGYLMTVNFDALAKDCADHHLTAWMEVSVGDYVIPGDTLAKITVKDRPATDDDCDAFMTAFKLSATLGPSRTEIQDIRYATQMLIDMAVRALSPAMNDPFTAQNALDELASGLSLAASRPLPDNAHFVDGHLALRTRQTFTRELVDNVFDDIRVCGMKFPIVMIALARFGGRIASYATEPDLIRHIRTHLDILDEAYAATHPIERDVHRVRAAIEEARTIVSTRLGQTA